MAIGNNGIGIAPGKMDQLFQPFSTMKSEIKRLGLGLSVRHINVGHQRGEIRVASNSGEGSNFTVVLPVAEKIS